MHRRLAKILRNFAPDAVEHISVGKDSNVDVVDENRVEVACLFIAEKSVWHPNLARIGQGQIFQSA